MDPYNNSGWTHLHSLAQMIASGFADTPPPSNAPRTEPTPATGQERAAITGQSAVEGELSKSDEQLTADWVKRMKEANDLAHPKAAKARAKTAEARADKKATQDWVNKMRAAKEGQKAVGKELDKPPPPSPNDLSERIETQRENLMRSFPGFEPTDPRTSPAGEDAVRKALTDINMKPLIDHAMAVQEAWRRADAIRQMIEAMRNQPPPELPDSQIPENTNRPPGSENSYVTAHDYSMLPEGGGVRGVGFPPLRPPTMPPPANPPSISVVPGAAPSLIFGPRRTNPDQPHFPVGIDPNLTPPQPPVE